MKSSINAMLTCSASATVNTVLYDGLKLLIRVLFLDDLLGGIQNLIQVLHYLLTCRRHVLGSIVDDFGSAQLFDALH